LSPPGGAHGPNRSPSRRSRVAVIDADGSGLQPLTENISGNHGFPSRSPDGRKIVYRSTNGETKGLAVIDVASRATTALPSGAWT
jgi:Tol biopolymer transport system component